MPLTYLALPGAVRHHLRDDGRPRRLPRRPLPLL